MLHKSTCGILKEITNQIRHEKRKQTQEIIISGHVTMSITSLGPGLYQCPFRRKGKMNMIARYPVVFIG
jgi:hypothetical protein